MVVTVTVLHVAVAAAWFGHKLLIPRDVRDSILDPGSHRLFIARMARAERLGVATGLLTVLSGLGLVYLTTGFRDAPIRIWVAAAAVLAMFGVGALVARPARKRIQAGLEADDPRAAAAAVVPFTRAIALENLLWVLALMGMIA